MISDIEETELAAILIETITELLRFLFQDYREIGYVKNTDLELFEDIIIFLFEEVKLEVLSKSANLSFDVFQKLMKGGVCEIMMARINKEFLDLIYKGFSTKDCEALLQNYFLFLQNCEKKTIGLNEDIRELLISGIISQKNEKISIFSLKILSFFVESAQKSIVKLEELLQKSQNNEKSEIFNKCLYEFIIEIKGVEELIKQWDMKKDIEIFENIMKLQKIGDIDNIFNLYERFLDYIIENPIAKAKNVIVKKIFLFFQEHFKNDVGGDKIRIKKIFNRIVSIILTKNDIPSWFLVFLENFLIFSDISKEIEDFINIIEEKLVNCSLAYPSKRLKKIWLCTLSSLNSDYDSKLSKQLSKTMSSNTSLILTAKVKILI